MESMKFYTHEEVLDEIYGKPGTSERDAFETRIEMRLVGWEIRKIREAKKLSQEDLGKLIGVQKARISKIENGNNLTVETIVKVFKALDVDAKIHIGSKGVDFAVA